MLHARRARALAATAVLIAAAIPLAPLAATAPRPHAASNAAKKTPAPKAKAKAKPKQTGYHPHNGPAPADEYFGRLGMSILGVRNKVKDLGLQADAHPDRGAAILSNALWVEDAMRAWARSYPFDRWLPRYAFALEQTYEEIPGDAAHKRAIKQLAYITAYFPQTVYGKVGRAKLAQGIRIIAVGEDPPPQSELERLALIDGKVIPTIPPAATPTPTASPSPEASPSPAIAVPEVSATAVPSPAASASPKH
jgi:hypothetical protein